MTFTPLKTMEEVDKLLQDNQLTFLYVTQPNCSVCQGLEPQLIPLLDKYTAILSRRIDVSVIPEIAGKFSIFTAPVVLLFVDGKEYIRKARFVPIAELDSDIERIYNHLVE